MGCRGETISSSNKPWNSAIQDLGFRKKRHNIVFMEHSRVAWLRYLIGSDHFDLLFLSWMFMVHDQNLSLGNPQDFPVSFKREYWDVHRT